MEERNLGKKTIAGMMWSFIDLLSNQGIQFITLLILARLLTPESFGLISMVTILIAVSNAIIDGGFTQALIREKEVSREDYSTVFFFNLLVSFLLYGLIYALAGFISDFFGEPQLKEIVRILSLVIIISSFGFIQKVMIMRHLNFKALTIINLIASLSSGVVAIVCAFKGMGVWSIIIRTLLMQFIQIVLFWSMNKWTPVLVFKFRSLKRLFSFGSKLMLSSIIDTLYNNLFFVIIGKFYSPTLLGYYTNAASLSNTASIAMTTTIQRVSYPALSKIQHEEALLKQSFRKVIRTACYIAFPVMIGLSAVAEPLILLLYGEKWSPSIIYFQLLCLAFMLYPLNALYLNILQVKGRSDLFLFLEIVKKSLLTILVVTVVYLKLDVEVIVGTVVIYTYICLFINAFPSSKLIGYTFKEQFEDIVPIFISTAVMGVIVYASQSVMPDSHLLMLILQILLGVSLYIALSLILRIKEFKTLWTIMLSVFNKMKIYNT